MKVGDVVQLKSGGPKMVIQDDYGIDEKGQHWFTCEWFEDTKPKSADFLESSLKLV